MTQRRQTELLGYFALEELGLGESFRYRRETLGPDSGPADPQFAPFVVREDDIQLGCCI
jgi:hypothetical protein